MRRIFSTLTAFVFILSLFPVSLGATETSGDPNIATGGGGTIGAKTSDDSKYSTPYPDGIRASIVEINPTTGAYVKTYGVADYTNYISSANTVDINFGNTNKLQYKSGASLSAKFTYAPQTLAGLPRIVDTATHPAASEAEIREYFSHDNIFINIAQNMGATTSTAESMLISGKYKLLIEPMVYVIFEGKTYAFTATEAALFNKSRKSAGLSTLREKLVSVTHMNLPLALFLRKSDLGIPAFTGRNGGTQDDNTIVSTLGAGIGRIRPNVKPLKAELSRRIRGTWGVYVPYTLFLCCFSEVYHMSANAKTVVFPIRLSEPMLSAVKRAAGENGCETAEQIRRFIQKGLDVDGYKKESDFIRTIIRDELSAIVEPFGNRIIKMLMKIGKVSAGGFFLMLRNIFGGKADANPKGFNEFSERYMGMGVDYMKYVKDRDADAFLMKDGVSLVRQANAAKLDKDNGKNV